jgi:NAD dependent epimerase/dehydratase family enzyme
MLPPFKLGIGGPVAGGRQYMPWIALDDVAGIYVAALHDEAWSGPVNASAPNPVTNGEFSKSLGRVLGRPAVMPVPAFVLRARYGEMATVVTDSIRMVPARALELGHRFRYPELDPALRAALGV